MFPISLLRLNTSTLKIKVLLDLLYSTAKVLVAKAVKMAIDNALDDAFEVNSHK